MFSTFATLQKTVEIAGIALHCGAVVKARLMPSDTVGLNFARTDLPGAPKVEAALRNVTSTTHATTLFQNGAMVSTTEHLLAALWASGITHCRIELDGPEVPILDGSALPWLEVLDAAGRQLLPGARPVFQLKETVIWEENGARVAGSAPQNGENDEFRLQVSVDFAHPHAGEQKIELSITPESFRRELALARTFTLESWLQALREAGLIQGGNLDNAILIGEFGPSSPWRVANELARHKALDLVGDLALWLAPTGARFCGRIEAQRAGHAVHRAWMESVQNSKSVSVV